MSFIWPTSHVGMLHPFGPVEARQQARHFLAVANAASQKISYSASKKRVPGSSNQAETRKSLYEEIGLLYVPRASNELYVTAIGQQLLNLLGIDPPESPDETLSLQVDALLCWALANCQFNRPQSRGVPRPTKGQVEASDLKPYLTFWKAIRDLDGYLTITEFGQVLCRIMTVAEYDGAITTIKAGRESGGVKLTLPEDSNHRIYWKSHASVSEQVVKFDASNQRFVINPRRLNLVTSILSLQSGCGMSSQALPRARGWTHIHDYYQNIGGVACPAFLASGQIIVANLDQQPVYILTGYSLSQQNTSYVVQGGTELCQLPLKACCFHESLPNRLLRVDQKTLVESEGVRIVLGRGLPLLDSALLMARIEGRDT